MIRIKNMLKDLKDEYDVYISDKEIFDRIEKPKFKKAEKIHDWRNYVSLYFIDKWNEFSEDVKLLLFLQAEKQTSNEEWD